MATARQTARAARVEELPAGLAKNPIPVPAVAAKGPPVWSECWRLRSAGALRAFAELELERVSVPHLQLRALVSVTAPLPVRLGGKRVPAPSASARPLAERRAQAWL